MSFFINIGFHAKNLAIVWNKNIRTLKSILMPPAVGRSDLNRCGVEKLGKHQKSNQIKAQLAEIFDCVDHYASPTYRMGPYGCPLSASWLAPLGPLSSHHVAAANPCCCVRVYLNNLSRLWVEAFRCHSASAFSRPLSRNRRKPRASLIWPFTDFTIAMSWA